MQRILGFLCLLVGATVVTLDAAPAQELPPPDILRALAGRLPHHPRSGGTAFQPSGAPAADPVCRMQRFTMTLAAGTGAARSLPVLLDRQPADANAPVSLMTVLRRVRVDADGSPRTYHPDDPHAKGTCTSETGPDGHVRYRGICALDNFFSGNIQVFHGTQKLSGGELTSQWQDLWPLIRDKKLAAFDLKQYVPTAADGYYFFYWKERGLSAFFKRDIIPDAADGYPCRHDGYFVSATTLQQDGAGRSDSCAPSRFMDAERVPYFVLPDDAFGNARLGDIVVARLEGSDRVVYGIVGDTGPLAKLGEASIAFNQALLGKSSAMMNERDTDAVDISGMRVTVLVLGGTRPQLHGNYSRQNIEAIGSREFARWNGDPSSPTRRLDACTKQSVADR